MPIRFPTQTKHSPQSGVCRLLLLWYAVRQRRPGHVYAEYVGVRYALTVEGVLSVLVRSSSTSGCIASNLGFVVPRAKSPKPQLRSKPVRVTLLPINSIFARHAVKDTRIQADKSPAPSIEPCLCKETTASLDLMVSGRRIGEKEWAKNVPVSTLHLHELANSFGRVLNIRCGF